MARKRSSSGNFLSIPFLAGGLFVLIIAGFLLMNITSNSTDVKSARDTRIKETRLKDLKNVRSDSSKLNKLKECLKSSRITAFSLEGACENNARDAFNKATYSCQDGSSGAIENGCHAAASLLAKAKIACAKTVCPRPTSSPSTETDSTQ